MNPAQRKLTFPRSEYVNGGLWNSQEK